MFFKKSIEYEFFKKHRIDFVANIYMMLKKSVK